MKHYSIHILFLLLFCLISHPSFSQTGGGINFQSIARDATGTPITNQTITLDFTIYKGISAGLRQYTERHIVVTDDFGLFNVVIGEGTQLSVSPFSAIGWADDVHHLGIVLDDGNGRVNLGTTQFVSVPYSRHANTSDKAVNMKLNDITDVDTAGLATGKMLKWNGTKWAADANFGGYWGKPNPTLPIISYNEGTTPRVGIGVDFPTSALHVHNGQILISNDTTTTQSGLRIRLKNINYTGPAPGPHTQADFNSPGVQGYEFTGNGSKLLDLEGNGNVGMGGISPVNSLNIHKASGNNYIQFTQGPSGPIANTNIGFRVGMGFSGDGFIRMFEDKSIYFQTDNTTRMTIFNSSNGGAVRIATFLSVTNGITDNTLSGTGLRNVMADQNGKLIEEAPWSRKSVVSVGTHAFTTTYTGSNTIRRNVAAHLGPGEQGALQAPVNLPHGASVTKVVFHFIDKTNTVDLDFSLLRASIVSSFPGPSIQTLAAQTSSGSSTSPVLQSLTDNLIYNGVVNNELHFYYISVSPANNGIWPPGVTPNLAVFKVDIHYSLP